MNNKTFMLTKTGRTCHELPWESKMLERPWKQGYTRVMIPYTAEELKNSRNAKKCHIQIVRNTRLMELKKRLTLHKKQIVPEGLVPVELGA